MKILVDSTGRPTRGFPSFSVTPRIRGLENLVGVDTVVIHATSENDLDAVAAVSSLPESVDRLYYVCAPGSVREALKASVLARDGYFIDDEFYLSTEEDLLGMLSMGKELVLQDMAPAASLLDFADRMLPQLELSTRHKETISESLKEVVRLDRERKNEISKLARGTTELVKTLQIKGAEAEKKHKEVETELADLQALANEITSPRPGGSSISFFPRYEYPKNKRIIRIKELGTVPYLTSFALGLAQQISVVQKAAPKVIFLLPPGKYLEDKFEQYSWVTNKNTGEGFRYVPEVVFTNYPSSQVLRQLIEDKTKSHIIVVDRLVHSGEHLVKYAGDVWYATMNKSAIAGAVRKSRVITANPSIDGAPIRLRAGREYPTKVADRERFYLSLYNDAYKEMLK